MLSAEQKRELKRVAVACGLDGDEFVAMIEARGEGMTKFLEDTGVAFKAKAAPTTPGASFLEAVSEARTRTKVTPQPPDTKRWEAARQSADGGASLLPSLKATKAANSTDVAVRVAKVLQPQMDSLFARARSCGAQLDAIAKRLDFLEGKGDVEATKAMLFPGGNTHRGSAFNWGALGNMLGGGKR